MRGAALEFADLGQLQVERREHLLPDDGLRPAGPVAREPRVPRLARQRLHQHRLAGLQVPQGLQLRQGQVQAEVRREDPARGVMPLAVDVLLDGERKGLQPVEIGLGVLRRLHLVLVVQEVRDVLVGPGQLADHIGRVAAADIAEAEALAPVHGRTELEVDGIVVDPAGGREAGPADAPEGPELAALADQLGLLVSQGAVVEPVFEAGPRPVVEPQRGGALGAVVDVGVEDAVELGDQALVGGSLGQGDGRESRRHGDARAGDQQASAVQHRKVLPQGAQRPMHLSRSGGLVKAAGQPAAAM